MNSANNIFVFFIIGIIFISGCAVEQVSVQEVTEDISFVKEDFEEFLEGAAEENIEVSEDFINHFNSLLDQAINEFEQDNFVEASTLVEQAEMLLEDVYYDTIGDEDDENYDEEVIVYWQSIWNPNIEATFGEITCDNSKKPFEFNVEPYHTSPIPDTYLVRVYVETTSVWTSVEVEGVQSLTVASFIPHKEIGKIVNVDGLNVYELSSETEGDVPTKITAEFDVIFQKDSDTAVFRINKVDSGTTIYKLYAGNSEIAQFIHDGEENIKTFNLDLDLLSSPLSLPSVEERYNGPLFDTHLHLIGSESQGNEGIETSRLFINPKNADDFFAMMDKQGVIGLIGFLPINHEDFVSEPTINDFIQNPAGAVIKQSCNRIIPFLHPDSLLGIPPNKLGDKLPKFIDLNYKGNPIPFRGIGELHTDFPNDLYDNVRLVDPAMFELYDYAAENNLMVMIHPREIDLEDLHIALQHNRKTIFILHGDEGIEKIIPPLMEKNDNLYYSIDAGLMYPYSLPIDGMTKEMFLNNLHSKEKYYRLLASALHFWKPLIEAYPDRIMWGTDALWSWHFEHEVYSEVTWFARDFIGGLDPSVQEKFAYKNAERLSE